MSNRPGAVYNKAAETQRIKKEGALPMAYIDCKLKSQLLQRTVAVKLYFLQTCPPKWATR